VRKWSYRYAGLSVVSELELPEWEAFYAPGECENTDVSISVVAALGNVSPGELVELGMSECEYRFVAPDVGIYRINDGNLITVFPLPSAGQNEIRLFLLGTAWGALCYQRGLFAVHASAVRVGEEAVLFCALQGKGKSTMTAWLAAAGHDLVSDDLCCIHMTPQNKPEVYPSTQRFRLWSDALEFLGWESNKLERDHFRFEKFLVTWQGRPMLQPLPIKAIYLLEWGNFSLERLSGMSALQRFVSSATYRGGLLCEMGLSGTYWQSCLQLLQKVPIWELRRQKDLSMMDSVVGMLKQQWSSGNL
jgi:hypothetical protein